ncbi:hypothetical protein BH11BAC4_BH11BAC4_09320 [soil metagenome]
MKLLFAPLVASLVFLQVNNSVTNIQKKVSPTNLPASIENSDETNVLNFQNEGGTGKMSAVKFKAQEFCRAELENFDFDAHFSIISANVYFSGANFKNNIERSSITSASLKPIAKLMARCTAGTIVVFDDVKVLGPDKEVRTIQGLTLILY